MANESNGLYIFEGLTQKEIAYFIMMSETLHFKKGETIISEGDESDNRAYLLESGSVDILRQKVRIATLQSGDIFGEMALITNEPRNAQVIAREDTEVLAFNKDEFLILYKRSDLYEEMKNKILMRLKANFYAE